MDAGVAHGALHGVGTEFVSDVRLLVLAWIFIWIVVHYMVWSLWNIFTGRCLPITCAPSPRERYRRKLCRSQIYCFVASVGGVHLLHARCAWTAEDLLHTYTPEHEILFAMAAAHWIVSLYEDFCSWEFLGSEAVPLDPSVFDPAAFLYRAYVVHHVFAGCGYLLVLHLRCCVAVCTFGLVYEAPVLLMNHREFAVIADLRPEWFLNHGWLSLFWRSLLLLWFVARFGPSMVYLYSVVNWRDDLAKLNMLESLTYHVLAIFFTLLNVGLSFTFLAYWRRADTDAADRVGRGPGGALTFKERKSPYNKKGQPKDPSENKYVNLDVPTVKACTQKDLESHASQDVVDENGQGKVGQLWIAIDGAAYNITSFLQEHPGGEEVLRQHAGKDASDAFHRAKHSMNARKMMQKYLVGPINRVHSRYTLFEHPVEMGRTQKNFPGSLLAIGFIFVRYTPLINYDSLLSQVDGKPTVWMFEPACVPGLVMMTLIGVLCIIRTLINIIIQPSTFSNVISRSLSPGAHILSLQFVAYSVGFVLVNQRLPESLPTICPTGIELAGVLVFVFEDFKELLFSAKGPWSGFSFAAVGTLLSSWALRGITDLIDVAPGQVIGAVLLASSVSFMVTTFSKEKRLSYVELDTSVLLAGMWSVVLLCLASAWNSRSDEVLDKLWKESWMSWGFIVGQVVLCAISWMQLIKTSFLTSPAWAVRSYAFTLVAGVIVCGGFRSWRWLFVVAFFTHLGAMGSRLRSQLEAECRNDHDVSQAETQWYRFGTQCMWDQFRITSIMILWTSIVMPFVELVSNMLPEELAVFACEIPIFDLGEYVDLGVAAYYAPTTRTADRTTDVGAELGETGETVDDREDQDKPEFYVCNVGHIDTVHPAGLDDLQRTMNALRHVWDEFKSGMAPGLVANVVAVFPFIQGTTSAKEINLSAWASSEDAHDWYSKSAGHRSIMEQHTTGDLATFGNLLASLEPVSKIRLQDRCQRCRRLVEGEQVGDVPPLRCTYCGAKSFEYPLF